MPYKNVVRAPPNFLPRATFGQADAFKRRKDRRKKVHPLVSEGERKFITCNKCHVPLLYKNLARHLAEVHHVGERPIHQCGLCPYNTYRPEDLRRHTRSAHPQDLGAIHMVTANENTSTMPPTATPSSPGKRHNIPGGLPCPFPRRQVSFSTEEKDETKCPPPPSPVVSQASGSVDLEPEWITHFPDPRERPLLELEPGLPGDEVAVDPAAALPSPGISPEVDTSPVLPAIPEEPRYQTVSCPHRRTCRSARPEEGVIARQQSEARRPGAPWKGGDYLHRCREN